MGEWGEGRVLGMGRQGDGETRRERIVPLSPCPPVPLSPCPPCPPCPLVLLVLLVPLSPCLFYYGR
ncbi:MAG: hypothetical protein KME31_10635 [Tolypothrix carrinoi HA7290-LM1]|nr:hypothetical protein [Tolypothrix carrinoi HA7290-LM1]